MNITRRSLFGSTLAATLAALVGKQTVRAAPDEAFPSPAMKAWGAAGDAVAREAIIWDFAFDGLSRDGSLLFVVATRRGAATTAWNAYMFRWPRREWVQSLGHRGYCEWMLADERQAGTVGGIIIR